jgi:hypothetical protein
MAKALTGVSTIAATKIAPVHADAPTRAAAVPGEERHVIRGAPWEFYDRLTDALGESSPFRVAYDGQDIEIITLGPKQERSKGLLGSFIESVFVGLEIDCEELGSTTWKRPELERGIEADQCYCFEPSKLEWCGRRPRVAPTTSPSTRIRTWQSRSIFRHRKLTGRGFIRNCGSRRFGACTT